jgi:CheY-like chemotaxis protein
MPEAAPVRPRVLVVDDNHAHSYALARILSNAGFEVRQAYGGRSALRIATPGLAIILLDVHMPDINGFEVCKRLKSKPTLKHIPVVFVSSTMDEDEGRIRAKSAGAEDLYKAPVDPKSFVGRILQLIAKAS